MSKVDIFDKQTGARWGEIEIPDDVINAAVLVESWLRAQPIGAILCGIVLADRALNLEYDVRTIRDLQA